MIATHRSTPTYAINGAKGTGRMDPFAETARPRRAHLMPRLVIVTIALAGLATALGLRAQGPAHVAMRSLAATASTSPSTTGTVTTSTPPTTVAPTSSTSSSTTTTVPTSAPASDPRTLAACQGRLSQWVGHSNPYQVALAGVYPSTALDVAAYDERSHAAGFHSPFQDRPPAEFEAVCWFDSATGFGAMPHVVGSQASRPLLHNRIEEVVGPDGVPIGIAVGQKTTLPVQAVPAAGAAR